MQSFGKWRSFGRLGIDEKNIKMELGILGWRNQINLAMRRDKY
jgi:hypothetical protein